MAFPLALPSDPPPHTQTERNRREGKKGTNTDFLYLLSMDVKIVPVRMYSMDQW